MTRGTTPTHQFKLPFQTTQITKLNISYEQKGEIVLEKTLTDCTLNADKISVKLSEEETLKFEGGIAHIQIRIGEGDERLASTCMSVNVYDVIKEGVL